MNARIQAMDIEAEIMQFYKHLHENPELSGRERNTQKWILELLAKWNIECRTCADTGVYAVIKSGRPGHTIALRADMDALPVTEQTDLPYRSHQKGVMHACGHDAHMTMLLSCIRILSQRQEELYGNIVFLFQPSEEKDGGAQRMIAEGILKEPKPELTAAFHVWPQKAHTITCMPGPVMAQPDGFRIEVTGKGGHGAAPEACKNPITALAALIMAIKGMTADILSAKEQAVVTVCQMHCGENYNLVADSGYLEGTIRTYDTAVRNILIEHLNRLTLSIPAAYGMQGNFSMNSGYPATINDRRAAVWASDLLRQELTETEIFTAGEPSMLGEDFSYFGAENPILYMRLGCFRPDPKKQFPLHHSSFTIDESILAEGAAALCLLAEQFSKEGYERNEDD